MHKNIFHITDDEEEEQAWWRQWFDMWKEGLFHLAQTNLLHSLHYHDYTYSQLSVPFVEWRIPSRFPRICFQHLA
jgi:hypothetical protein